MKIFFEIKDIDRKPAYEWENTWISVSIDNGREISSKRAFVTEVTSCHELLFSWLVIVFGFFNKKTSEVERNCFCKVPLNKFMDRHAGLQRYAILSNGYTSTCFVNSLGDFKSVGEITLEFQVRDSTFVEAEPSVSDPQWSTFLLSTSPEKMLLDLIVETVRSLSVLPSISPEKMLLDLIVETVRSSPVLRWGITMLDVSFGNLHDILHVSYKIKDIVLADITHFYIGYMYLVRHFEDMLRMQKNAYHERHSASDEDFPSSGIYKATLEVDLSAQRRQASASHAYRIRSQRHYEYYRLIFYFAIAPYGGQIAATDVEDRLPCDTRTTGTTFDKILRLLGIPERDLLNVCITNVKGKCSFIVFLYKHYLVVSFRGTTSPKDIYEDFRYEYVRIGDGYTHMGIKDLAEGFVQDHCENIRGLMSRHGKTHLLLTGHSMGGSVAIVVGYIILRTGFIENAKLKVVGVSPAPVFSEHIVQNWPYRNFRAIAVDFDIVPFLSLGSFLDFKYICCCFGYRLNNRCYISNPHREVQRLQDFLLHENIHMKLYLPGIIVHLRSFRRTSPDALDKLWNQTGGTEDAIRDRMFVGVKKYTYTFSRQIYFSSNMINPHLPCVIQRILDTALESSKYIEDARKKSLDSASTSTKKIILA